MDAVSMFISKLNEKQRCDQIYIPAQLEQNDYTGDLFGFSREDSGYHIILGWEGEPCPEEIGAVRIGSIGGECEKGVLGTRQEDGRLAFEWRSDGEVRPLQTMRYTLTQDIFSRNSGLLESGKLAEKCAMLAGVGSVGSTVALELARAGVGRFIIADPDVIEIHNLSRHQCDITDVGKYKADAVAERILRINPNAEIRKYYRKIQQVPADEISDWVRPTAAAVFSGCDSMEGNACAGDLAEELKVPFVCGVFFSLAWGLELYYCVPELGDIPFREGMKDALAAESRRLLESLENGDQAAGNHFYAGQEDLMRYSFQPGVGNDVFLGSSVIAKLGLDVLNLYDGDYVYRLLPYLHQYTQLVLNRDPRLGGGEHLSRFENKPFQYITLPVEGSEIWKEMNERAAANS